MNLLTSPVMIPLTQGKFALIDRQDYQNISRFKWHVHFDKKLSFTYPYAKARARLIDGKIVSPLPRQEVYRLQAENRGNHRRLPRIRDGIGIYLIMHRFIMNVLPEE